MENKELMITLWNHCNNRCFFCYNRGYYHFPIDIKNHLNKCLELLKSDNIKEYTCIRLVGGELFDGFIDECGIEKEFLEILQRLEYLINNNTIQKINVVTNLIYLDERMLLYVLNKFKDKITLSTSYDEFGRFISSDTETFWWRNIELLQRNYPQLEVDVGINITQPFITSVTKEWIDNFYKRSDYRCEIKLNELDTALIKNTKEDSPFSDLFPKRHDFLKFLHNLKDWNYYNLVGVEPGGISPWNRTLSIQYIQSGDLSFPVFKNLSYLLSERAEYKQDGYIDSNVPLFEDIKKIMEL